MNQLHQLLLWLCITISVVHSQGGGGGSGGGGSGGGGGGGGSGYGYGYGGDRDGSGSVEDIDLTQDELIILISICTSVPLMSLAGFLIYKKIKARRNEVATNTKIPMRGMTVRKCEDSSVIQRVIQKYTLASWECGFFQKKKEFKVSNLKLRFLPTKKESHWKVVMSGSDIYGSWTAQGEIVFSLDNPLQFYIVKSYDNKQKAGQTGQWHTLVYKGQFEPSKQQFEGDWYYEGFQGSSEYSGRWYLSIIQN